MTLEIHTRPGHAPMRIVARMVEPVGYLGDLMHIDGMISYGAYHDLDDRTRRTIEPIEVTEWPIDIGLPLAVWSVAAPAGVDERLCKSRGRIRANTPRHGKLSCAPGDDHRLWGWCASAADDSAWLARGALEIRKKPALGAMGRYTGDRSANLGAGHMKAYDLRIPTVTALEIEWFALGEVDYVRHLLVEHVPSIGKKRNLGAGRVSEWIVEHVDVDRSVLHEGRPTRRLPAGAAEGRPGHGGIRPPYYHHTRAVAAVEP